MGLVAGEYCRCCAILYDASLILPLLRLCSLAVGFVLSLLGAIFLFFGDIVMFASAYSIDSVMHGESFSLLQPLQSYT